MADTGFPIDGKTLVEIIIALVGLGTLWGRVEFGIDPTAKEAKKLAEAAAKEARELAEETSKETRALHKEAKDYSDRLVDEAKRFTDEAKKIAVDAHSVNASIQGSIAVFREQVAINYVSREAMKDLETRLSNDIGKVETLVEKMEQTLVRAIGEITQRMDRDRSSRPRPNSTSS